MIYITREMYGTYCNGNLKQHSHNIYITDNTETNVYSIAK